MKKFLLIVVVAALAVLADSQLASARRGGCGGGRGGHGGGCGGSGGGCGMGGMGGGYMMGGCSSCGMGGGYMMGGCSSCGMGGGYVMGGMGGCPGGVCALGGGATLAQANVNEATLVVTLPEDAKLTIDGEETTSTSAQRVFVSPTLESGKEYEYTLKAQILRDGKIQTATAQVTVRPGEVSRVELKVPAAGVAAQ